MRNLALAVVAALIVSLVLSTVGVAAPQTRPEDEIGDDFDFWSLREGAKFDRYYRARAQISSERQPEHRLANGVRWRLLIDERTGIRMPRITWMPSRRSMAVANDFLQMAHGAMIAHAEDFNRIVLGNNTIRRAVHGLPPFSPPPLQNDVEVTYATSRFVSTIDVGAEQTSEKPFRPRSDIRIFDLVKGTVYKLGLCPLRYEHLGYGEWIAKPRTDSALFSVCNDAEDAAFHEVVKRWALAAIPPRERGGEAELGGCYRAADVLARWGRGGLIYLTPNGFALLLSDWPPIPEASCRLATGDPVVIPYQALKRFMRPGPLRDELLKLR